MLNIETQPPQLTPTTNGVNILLKTRATTIKILFSVISEHLRIVESNVVRGRSYIDLEGPKSFLADLEAVAEQNRSSRFAWRYSESLPWFSSRSSIISEIESCKDLSRHLANGIQSFHSLVPRLFSLLAEGRVW